MKKRLNSQFKIYSTDTANLNDSNFANKLNDEILKNDLSCTQSNKDLIKALKSKLEDELMPHMRVS